MTDTTEQKREALRKAAQRRIDSIRSNSDLSPEAKIRHLAKAHTELADGLDAMRATATRTAITDKENLQRQLWGIPSADPGSVITYRDALDRVASLEQSHAGEREAIQMLERGAITGDETLVRAVLSTAFDRQWVDTINTFSARFPDKAEAVDQLWSFNGGTTAAEIVENAQWFAPAPEELRRYTPEKIRALGANEPANEFAV